MSYQAAEAERTIHNKMLTQKRSSGGGQTTITSDSRIAQYAFTDDQTFNIGTGVFPANYPMSVVEFDKVVKKSVDVSTPFRWTAPSEGRVIVNVSMEVAENANLARHVLHIRHKDDEERDAAYSIKAVKEGTRLKMSLTGTLYVYADDEISIGLSVKNLTATAQTLTLKNGQVEIRRA